MEEYFRKFPPLVYNNTICLDISRRVKFDEKTRNYLTQYYTYTVKDGTRANSIADVYYEDPQLDWIIWMTNFMVDPYYQWNLSDHDFTDYLIKKYGSVEASVKKIVYYRNNWYNDNQVLTPEFYNNQLHQGWRKYYAPFYGIGVKILYWKRREEDWVVETNQIWKLSVANPSVFVKGELVDVKNNNANRVGGGEVTAISDTYIMIKNIDASQAGLFVIGNVVTGETSQIDQTITDVNKVYQAIADDEAVFWSPVTFYDIENEKNAYNRTINILDKKYLPTAVDQINKLLRE